MAAAERILETHSEEETSQLGARLAAGLALGTTTAFVRLSGGLGAGKSAFARGFIRKWGELAGEPVTENIVSPTFNVVKTYGKRRRLAHMDLYRIKSLAELEQVGYEHYFFEQSCCLVEWLEQVPEALHAIPPDAIEVTIDFIERDPTARRITVRSRRAFSLAP